MDTVDIENILEARLQRTMNTKLRTEFYQANGETQKVTTEAEMSL
jgi:hypothetical protein